MCRIVPTLHPKLTQLLLINLSHHHSRFCHLEVTIRDLAIRSVVGVGPLVGGVVLAITVIVVGIIDVGGKMDNHESVWDEDLTSDLEWRFIEPVPKAFSMPPVLPRAPPTPFVTVQDLQPIESTSEIDHMIPDSLPSIYRIGRDPLPIPDHKPNAPASLTHVVTVSHQSNSDSSDKPLVDTSVQPPTPAFHVEPAKRIQSGSQPVQPKKRTRRSDLLS